MWLRRFYLLENGGDDRMLQKVWKLVSELLKTDRTGHGMDHIERVLTLSLDFCKQEKANKEIVALIAILHDVDDYKLFDNPQEEALPNAKRIMQQALLSEEIQQCVCDAIQKIGYSKRLKGLYPSTIEGRIVSDADMCDAIGAHGILRTYQYGQNKEKPFFDKEHFPQEDLTADTYTQGYSKSSVNHFFEKILQLKDLMLTASGKEEAEKRHIFTISFLQQYFTEEKAFLWLQYLQDKTKDYIG